MPTVAERNIEFLAMDRQQQRVAIARDALRLINAGAVTPKAKLYFRFFGPSGGDLVDLLGQEHECQACALGALFVGHVWNTNDCKSEVQIPADILRARLLGVFTDKQLGLIETAFEGEFMNPFTDGRAQWGEDVDAIDDPDYQSQVRASIRFGADRGDDEDCLVAILENIIANGGDFKPEVIR
jgi:hypothetical protein